MMWELAKDEEYQGQMRDEIAAMRGPRLYAIRDCCDEGMCSPRATCSE